MVRDQLHQLIEQCKWTEILQGGANNNPDLCEDARRAHREDLPLHMACERRAPDAVILAMLKLNPDATKWKGRGDNMALHVATHRNLSEEVIEALIRAYPEALDEVNQAKVTPRNIGHSDLQTYQALRRPTACWHQLMKEETLEEAEVTRLKTLHEQVDAALAQVQLSDNNMVALTQRLQKVEGELDLVESAQHEKNTTRTIEKLQETLREDLEAAENSLGMVEDDIKSAEAREFMAKAASRAHQSDVLRMQKKSNEVAKVLLQQVEQVRVMAMQMRTEKTVSAA